MKFYFVRHGETNWNLNRKIQGASNIPLNETGLEQAHATATRLSNIKFDYALSSTLDRAFDTCNIIVSDNNLDLKINKTDGLIERKFGEFEGGSVDDFLNLKDCNLIKGYESDEELQERTIKAWEHLLNENYENILITSHAGTMKSILFGLFPEHNRNFLLPNCALMIIEYKDGVFNLLEIDEHKRTS